MFEQTKLRGSALVTLGVVLASVVGLVAVGVAPVGADGTGASQPAVTASATTLQQTSVDYDVRLNSTANYWQGQRLLFNGTVVVENEIDEDVRGATPSERTFQLRRVEDGRVGDIVTQFVVNRDGLAALNVSDRTGKFVIVYQGDVVGVNDSLGRVTGAMGSGSVPASQWEVSRQELSVSFDDGRVRPGYPEDVTIKSNRAGYSLRVSAPGVDDDDLAQLFGSRVVEQNSRENYVVIRANQSNSFTIRPSADFPRGSHAFRFAVTDSVARTTAPLEISGSAPTATPTTEVPTTTAGTTTGPTTEGPMPTTVSPTTSPPTTEMPTTEPGTTTAAPNTTTAPRTYAGTGTAGSGPGFGIVVTLLALLGIALLARRR